MASLHLFGGGLFFCFSVAHNGVEIITNYGEICIRTSDRQQLTDLYQF